MEMAARCVPEVPDLADPLARGHGVARVYVDAAHVCVPGGQPAAPGADLDEPPSGPRLVGANDRRAGGARTGRRRRRRVGRRSGRTPNPMRALRHMQQWRDAGVPPRCRTRDGQRREEPVKPSWSQGYVARSVAPEVIALAAEATAPPPRPAITHGSIRRASNRGGLPMHDFRNLFVEASDGSHWDARTSQRSAGDDDLAVRLALLHVGDGLEGLVKAEGAVENRAKVSGVVEAGPRRQLGALGRPEEGRGAPAQPAGPPG